MKVQLDKGAKLPTRAYTWDAGFDLYAPEAATIPARGSVVIDTGVHVEIPEGYVGFIKSRSGLNTKHGIVSDSGVIDSGYIGSIRVKLYNNAYKCYEIKPGNRICQIVFLPVFLPELKVVDSLGGETERGANGFGSSGE